MHNWFSLSIASPWCIGTEVSFPSLSLSAYPLIPHPSLLPTLSIPLTAPVKSAILFLALSCKWDCVFLAVHILNSMGYTSVLSTILPALSSFSCYLGPELSRAFSCGTVKSQLWGQPWFPSEAGLQSLWDMSCSWSPAPATQLLSAECLHGRFMSV